MRLRVWQAARSQRDDLQISGSGGTSQQVTTICISSVVSLPVSRRMCLNSPERTERGI